MTESYELPRRYGLIEIYLKYIMFYRIKGWSPKEISKIIGLPVRKIEQYTQIFKTMDDDDLFELVQKSFNEKETLQKGV